MKVHASSNASAYRRQQLSILQAAGAIYHWMTWGFVGAMTFSQFLCIFNYSTTTFGHSAFGQDPRLGITSIIGQNDIPYSDRAMICVLGPDGYEPRLVSQVISSSSGSSKLIDSSGSYVGGYRFVPRQINTAIDPLAYKVYLNSCSRIEATLSSIVKVCNTLGYENVVPDVGRAVAGNQAYEIPFSLPVLIIPFYDNSQVARFILPTSSGDSCAFRLYGNYADASDPKSILGAINKSVRHDRVQEWLGRPDGVWRNGWYEDRLGDRWNADFLSTSTTDLNISQRIFDMDNSGQEIDCSHNVCYFQPSSGVFWTPKIAMSMKATDFVTVYVGNATQHGLFTFRSSFYWVVVAKYDWQTLLSNASITLLLLRWMFAMLSLHHGYFRGETQWHNCGISSISGSTSFQLLLFRILPHLKMVLCAIWTVGCDFEGQQRGMSASWFTVYPAIVEFALAFFSVLSLIAKITRRRMSDAMFVPTIAVLCAMHYWREELAASGWLRGVDGRVTTVVYSNDVEKLRLTDMFTSDIALRLNGNIRELFVSKLVLFGVNLLPLVFGRPIPGKRAGAQFETEIEKALAISHRNVGGLDTPLWRFWRWCSYKRSPRVAPSKQEICLSKVVDRYQETTMRYLSSYELIQLGYVVYGGKFVMKFDDWDIISLFEPLRQFFHLWNHRVTVWTLKDDKTMSGSKAKCGAKSRRLESLHPELLRLDDPRLLQIRFWHISACDIE